MTRCLICRGWTDDCTCSSDEPSRELREMNAELLDALKIAREYVASVEGSLRSRLGDIGDIDTVVTPDLRKVDNAITKAGKLK